MKLPRNNRSLKLPNSIKLRTYIGLGLLAILLPIVFISLFKPASPEAAWFDGGYGFRKAITFTHNAALSDRRVSFTVDTAALTTDKMQADCDDTRFTDANGKVLDYQVVSGCDSASTQYDVVFPAIINGSNLAYMYYGNPSAVGASQDVSAVTSLSPSGGAATFATEEITPGPIAEWKFDEGQGQTVQDSSSNNNDGTLGATSGSSTDDPTWVAEDQCVSGKCLQLDGSSDFARMGTVGFNGTAGSVSLWSKNLDSAHVDSRYMFSHRNTTNRVYLYKDATDGTLVVGVADNGDLDTNWNIDLSRWHHYVLTWNSGTYYVYVDGKQITTGSYTGSPITFTTTADIGKLASNTTQYWQGFIDEVKVFPYARSADQIQTDYVGGAARFGDNQAFLSDGLVGYWKMDDPGIDAEGETITDSSGNSNSGTLNGDNSTGDNGSGMDCTVIAKYGTGCDFDGTDDYVQRGDIGTSMSYLTFSGWFYNSSSFDNNDALLSLGVNDSFSAGANLARLYSTGAGLKFQLFDTLSTGFMTDTASSTYANSWTHYAVTISPDKTEFFVNGTLISTVYPTAGSTFRSYDSFIFGNSSTFNQGVDGILDDVRVYNRALSPAEVSDLYNFAPLPIAHWKMDDNTASTATDSSPNSNDLTLTNTPTWNNGKFGTSVLFSGSDQHLIRADDGDFDFADDASFTISAYVKHKTATAQEIILSKYQEAGYKVIMESDGDITCAMDYDGTWSPTDSASSTAATYDDNAWHHIACVKNGATSLNLYIDGVLITSDATLTATNTLTNSDPLYVGVDADGSSNDFTGYVDDVKIYTYARTVEQLQNDLEGDDISGLSGVKVPQPTVYYRMDEGQGTVAHNSSPITLNGALTNAVFKPNGKFNGTAYFDGTADYITVASNQALDGQDGITFSMWINPTSVTNSALPTLYNRSAQSNTVGFHWLFFNGGNNLHYQYSNGSTFKTLALGATVTLGSWQHLAVTHDRINRVVKTYLNGVLKDTDSAGEEMRAVTSGNAFLGTYLGAFASYYYQGYIDEFKIYDTVLTAEQVSQDMNAGAATNVGSTANSEASLLTDGAGTAPVGYWSFDEKQDNTCTGGTNDVCDKSGNGYDGAAINSPVWVPGKYGSALKFNGSSSYVALPDNLTDTHTTGTVCSWVYYNKTAPAVGSQGTIFSVGDSGGTISKHILYIIDTPDDTAELRAVIRPDGVANDEYLYASASNVMPRRQWTHICFRQQGNGSGVELFKNGVEIPMTATNSGAGSLDDWFDDGAASVENVTIGIIEDNIPDTWLDGSVDEVKLYNYARTDAQIAYDFNRGEPIAHWQMDECQGSTVYDNSGNGNNGTLTVGASGEDTIGTCNTSSTAWGSGATGKLNSSLGFDGTDDYVSATDNGVLNISGDYSVSVWVKTSNASQDRFAGIVVKTTDDTNGAYSLQTDNDNFKIFHGNSANSTTGISLAAIADSTWHHISYSYSGTTVTAYLDGKQKSQQTLSTPPSTGTGIILIGTERTKVDYWNGQIDDVRIYNYGLSASQVKTIYNGGAVNFSQ